MLASSVAAAGNSFIQFKNAGSMIAKILDWDEGGIKVVDELGVRKFYYYIEIDSIDGSNMDDLKTYKAFMKLWSRGLHWKVNSFRASAKGRPMYDRDKNILKKFDDLCKNINREEIIKKYNKSGNLRREITCARGERKTIKKFHGNGAVKTIIYFNDNEIISVDRFTDTGKKIKLGGAIENLLKN